MGKKKILRKRYILLSILAIIPFYNFVHFNDYCFGDKDLVVVGAFSVLFFIAFIVIVFYNLYNISLKKELFNYRPIIIFSLFICFLVISLKYHDKNLFKSLSATYKLENTKKDVELSLYEDLTFEIIEYNFNSKCYYKGDYFFRKDSVFFQSKNILKPYISGGYMFQKNRNVLISNSSKKVTYTILQN